MSKDREWTWEAPNGALETLKPSTDHQASEPLQRLNRADQQKSACLTRQLDKLANFDNSKQQTVGKNSKFKDYLSTDPLDQTLAEEKYEENFDINKLSYLFGSKCNYA